MIAAHGGGRIRRALSAGRRPAASGDFVRVSLVTDAKGRDVLNVLAVVENAGLSPTAEPWANLAAVVIMVSLFVWFIMRHIPAKDLRNEQRSDAKDAQFLATLAAERERSRAAAESGHAAAKALADNIGDMTHELRRFNDSALAASRMPIKQHSHSSED